jgi:hypothetical protein
MPFPSGKAVNGSGKRRAILDEIATQAILRPI